MNAEQQNQLAEAQRTLDDLAKSVEWWMECECPCHESFAVKQELNWDGNHYPSRKKKPAQEASQT